MCDERERLIGYVYDDCDGRERQEIEAHLSSCTTCRAEIAGLRRVRQDLLAWEVPEHESVWRPFVPARPVFSWRDMPVWAMAAAASVLLVAGGAGGVATHALLSPSTAATAAEKPESAGSTAAPATISNAELAALEQRVVKAERALEAVRAEISERTQLTLRSASSAQFDTLRRVSADINRLNTRTVNLEEKNNLLVSSLLAKQEGAAALPAGW